MLTQRQLICKLLEIDNVDIFYENLLSKVSDKVGPSFLNRILDLGLLSEEPVVKLGSPLDTFSQFIASKLSLGTCVSMTCKISATLKIYCYGFHTDNDERDLVVLYHDIGVLWPGNRYEKKLITLVSYGENNGYTAMAKTVGIPTAIAAVMVLQGKFGLLITTIFS